MKPGALEPGNIVHIDGRVLGRHEGIVNFTVGQRKGIKIPAAEALFVVRLDASTNEVIVGPRAALTTSGLVLRNLNWLGDKPLAEVASDGLPVYVRLRSSQAPRPATLFSDDNGHHQVVLSDGELGIAAGQACVFYETVEPGSVVLGGGFIAKTLKTLPAETVRGTVRGSAGTIAAGRH